MMEMYGVRALGMDAAQDRRDLAAPAQRVGEPGNADEPAFVAMTRMVGREQADPDAQDAAQPGQVVGDEAYDSLHRVFDEVAAQLRSVHPRVLDAVAV